MFDTSDDRELLSSFVRTKDERAFAELVQRHEGMMRAVAGRVCGDPHDAKDAMQRALVAFARRAGEIRAEPSVGPWLHRATTLEALAVRRQRINRSIREREAMEQQQLQTGSMPQEITVELDEAINRLAPKDRSVIVLHYLERLTFRAIAQKHGGTEAAWQKRGVRALGKLSHMLRRRGVVATGTALGTLLATSSAEAAVPYTAVKTMLNEVLRQHLAAGTQSSSTMLLLMKLKYSFLLSFVGGAVVSYGWNERRTEVAKIPEEKTINHVSDSNRIDESTTHEPAFSLQRIATAIRYHDAQNEVDPNAESRLRALMFSVPEAYLGSVRRLFDDIENPDRFGEIVACFYSRWAEIDLESARLAALSDESYIQPARRGVMLTWLNTSPDVAIEAILKYRTKEDLSILDEFVVWKSQHAPMNAAMLLDLLGESWPKAHRVLFEKVAKAWAYSDPHAAGEWIESYWNRDIRNDLLNELAWKVARKNVQEGLVLADRIDAPDYRRSARIGAIHAWGVHSGHYILTPAKGDQALDLSAGFPAGWNTDEITSLAFGTMMNNWNQYPALIAVAKTEEQKQAVYKGVIKGTSYSQPAVGADAVKNIDAQFASTEEGRETLSSFIKRWVEMDAQAAASWLEQQTSNAKTVIMREAIRNRTDH